MAAGQVAAEPSHFWKAFWYHIDSARPAEPSSVKPACHIWVVTGLLVFVRRLEGGLVAWERG